MKTLALACLLTLTSIASADGLYQLPTVVEIAGHSCGTPPAPQVDVLGSNPDGTQSGRVFAYTSCSSGGRGGGNSYDSGCASVVWSSTGQLMSYDIEWRMQGRYLPPASVCFGS
jgi:hypothetical protein